MLTCRLECHRGCRQSGVGLIELLVAIVIASLGLLSLAGMQAFAARHARLGQSQAMATHLAQDLGERMRANRSGSYAYNHSFSEQLASFAPDPDSPPSPRCTAAADSCTSDQMAIADLFDWRLDVRTLLPQGSVFVQPDASGDAAGVDVWIAWSEPRGRSGASDRRDSECPPGLALPADASVRCLYMRIRP